MTPFCLAISRHSDVSSGSTSRSRRRMSAALESSGEPFAVEQLVEATEQPRLQRGLPDRQAAGLLVIGGVDRFSQRGQRDSVVPVAALGQPVHRGRVQLLGEPAAGRRSPQRLGEPYALVGPGRVVVVDRARDRQRLFQCVHRIRPGLSGPLPGGRAGLGLLGHRWSLLLKSMSDIRLVLERCQTNGHERGHAPYVGPPRDAAAGRARQRGIAKGTSREGMESNRAATSYLYITGRASCWPGRR